MIYSVWPRVPYTFSSNIAKLQSTFSFSEKKQESLEKEFCMKDVSTQDVHLKKKKKALKVLNYKNGF